MGIYLVLIIIGLAAGFLGGSMGVGGGIIMVPVLTLLGFTQHQAQGTSLAVMLPPVTFLAVMNYYKSGHVNWKFAALTSLAFLIGGYFGSKTALLTSEHSLKNIFGAILIITGIKIIFFK